MSVSAVAMVVEHEDGAIRPISFELAAAARALASAIGARAMAIALGEKPDDVARAFASDTGLDVIAMTTPGQGIYAAEAYLSALPSLLEEIGAGYVCVGHTSQGWDFAPGLAVALQAAYVTAVEGLAGKGDRLVFRRTSHNGKAVQHVAASTERVVLTVQPGSFAWPGHSGVPGAVSARVVGTRAQTTRHLGFVAAEEGERGLDTAEVIVAAGRGIGSRDNVDLVLRLAATFPKGAAAGSRPVCDAGWLPYSRQVGQTGAVVRPKVYVACGISGATQHVYGMKDSGFIVAINKDPQAPIFRVADVGIAEDAAKFLPLLLAEMTGGS